MSIHMKKRTSKKVFSKLDWNLHVCQFYTHCLCRLSSVTKSWHTLWGHTTDSCIKAWTYLLHTLGSPVFLCRPQFQRDFISLLPKEVCMVMTHLTLGVPRNMFRWFLQLWCQGFTVLIKATLLSPYSSTSFFGSWTICLRAVHDYDSWMRLFVCISVMHPLLGVHTCTCTCTHLMWHFVQSLLPPHLSLPLPSVPGSLLKIHVRGESPHAIVCEKGVDFQCIIIHLTSKPTLVSWLTNLSHATILLFVIKISPALLGSKTLLTAHSDTL